MRVFAPALVICLLSFVAQQTRPVTPVEQVGVVAGVVVDTSGGVIPGATVTLRSGQRVERSTVTSSNGWPAKYCSGPGIAAENSVMLARLPSTIIARSERLPR